MPARFPSFLYQFGQAIVGFVVPLAPEKRCGVHSYLIAIVLMGIALFVRLAIAPVDAGLQFVTFFPAVTLAAIAGGLGAGLFASLIGVVLACYIFSAPYYSFAVNDVETALWSSLVFFTDGFIVSYAIEIMHRYRERYAMELQGESEAHLALVNSTRYLKRILDNLFTYVALLDTRGVVQEINKAPLDQSGYLREDIIGRYFHEAPWWSYDKTVQSQLLEAIEAAKQGLTTRYDVLVKMGASLVPIDFQISPVFDDSGKVIGLLPTATDISARKAAELEVHQLAFYDPLTNLPNRRLLNDRLSQTMAASKRSGKFGALLFLDLDNFKQINDVHGHDAGDVLLVEAADRLKRCVRESDTVARFGGDEFVVILNELDLSRDESTAEAGKVAEKIRTALSQPYLLAIQHERRADANIEHHCSVSIGLVLFINHEETPDNLLKWADVAMYQAKDAGRNKIQIYQPKT